MGILKGGYNVRYIILILVVMGLLIGNGLKNTIVKVDKVQEDKIDQIEDILNW